MKFVFALLHIPPSRHFYRVFNRSRLKFYGLFPSFFLKVLKAKASKIIHTNIDHEKYIGLTDSISNYYSASNFKVFVDSRCELRVSILGTEYLIPDCDISRVSTNEGDNELHKMTLGYCGFFAQMTNRLHENLNNFEKILKSLSPNICWKNPSSFNSIWHPYCVSHRLINYLLLLIKLSAAGLIETTCYNRLLKEIKLCIGFIESNIERELHYNHYSKNMIALYLARCVLNINVKSPFLMELRYSIDHQIKLDGMQAELCPMYHCHFSNDLDIVLKADGKDQSFNDYIKKRINQTISVTNLLRHSSSMSLFGDSWEGEASFCDDPNSGSLTALLNDSGYLVYRDEDVSFIFDIGAAGPDDNPGHAHSDYLHIELFLDGMPFLVDYGVPTYSSSDDRTYSRSSFAHNGPCVSERSFLETWGSFRTGRRSKARLVSLKTESDVFMALGLVQPYYDQNLKIFRKITKSQNKIEIEDTWSDYVARNKTPFLRFIIPKNAIDSECLVNYLNSTDSPRLNIYDGWVLDAEAQSVVFEECLYYSEYGKLCHGISLSIQPRKVNNDGISKLTLSKI